MQLFATCSSLYAQLQNGVQNFFCLAAKYNGTLFGKVTLIVISFQRRQRSNCIRSKFYGVYFTHVRLFDTKCILSLVDAVSHVSSHSNY